MPWPKVSSAAPRKRRSRRRSGTRRKRAEQRHHHSLSGKTRPRTSCSARRGKAGDPACNGKLLFHNQFALGEGGKRSFGPRSRHILVRQSRGGERRRGAKRG